MTPGEGIQYAGIVGLIAALPIAAGLAILGAPEIASGVGAVLGVSGLAAIFVGNVMTPPSKELLLANAVSNRDAAGVERALAAGADVNVVIDGRPILYDAMVISKSPDVVRALLAGGANPNQEYKEAPLLAYAVASEDEETAEALLRAGASLMRKGEKTDDPPRPIIWDAVLRGRQGLVRLLLAHGSDPNAIIAEDITLLMAAAGAGYLPLVEQLLAAGADPNSVKRNGDTPLTCAVWHGRTAVVERLLSAQVDPNRARIDGYSPLMLVALRESPLAIAEALLAAGEDPNARRQHPGGGTPLGLAIWHKRVELAKLLLEAGADPNLAINGEGNTPLQFAEHVGLAEMATELVRRGAK